MAKLEMEENDKTTTAATTTGPEEGSTPDAIMKLESPSFTNIDSVPTPPPAELDDEAEIVTVDEKKEEEDKANDVKKEEDEQEMTPEELAKKEKEEEELRIKYKDWPMKDISEPHENDVLYGRGGRFAESQ